MIRATSARTARRLQGEHGFTLIELLVVIIILGILAAVVVFAVGGVRDKGRGAAMAIDARTIRTAQEAYCANNQRYASADELVAGKYLSELPVLNQTDTAAAGTPSASGNCRGAGDLARSSYLITCNEAQEGCGGGGALKLGWRQEALPAGLPPGGLDDISFADATTGWAVGQGATVLKTQDGGASWVQQAAPASAPVLGAVDVVDRDYGWAVGRTGQVIATTNGADWSEQTVPPTSPIEDVDFVDRQQGWAVGGFNPGTILGTTNGGGPGGGTWSAQLTVPSTQFQGVFFFDRNCGWAAGRDLANAESVVYRTTNGGNPGVGGWQRVVVPGATGILRGLKFLDCNQGFVSASATGANFATSDGGLTWTQRPKACGNRNRMDFLNPRQGWASGSTGCAIATTADGARSWTVQSFPTPAGTAGLDFTDIAHGWVTGTGTKRIWSYAPR